MRLHLFEFLDQPWFPAVLRNGGVAYLETMYRLNAKANAAFAAKIDEGMLRHGATDLVDLCSGGSGPILHLLPALRAKQGRDVGVTLTDLYPAAAGREKVAALGDPRVKYLAEPVDATKPPASLAGMRTVFGGFHHLRPEAAKGVLAGAFAQRRSIAIFEATARKPALFLFGLLMPLVVLLATPAIRPLRASQLFFTYGVPLLPLFIMWDGLVSVVRTYTVDELRAMTADLQAPDYAWDIGELAVPGVPVKLPYVVGGPVLGPTAAR